MYVAVHGLERLALFVRHGFIVVEDVSHASSLYPLQRAFYRCIMMKVSRNARTRACSGQIAPFGPLAPALTSVMCRSHLQHLFLSPTLTIRCMCLHGLIAGKTKCER